MRNEKMLHTYILNSIPIGRSNAIHQAALAGRCGCTTSEVKNAIQTARRAGIVIASGRPGYWRPESRAEEANFLRLMEKQATSRFTTVSPLRRRLRQDPSQITLADIAGGGDVDV